MKLLLVVLVFCCVSSADKEITEEYAGTLTDKLINEIEKRLMEWDGLQSDGLEDEQSQPSCNFYDQENYIIRTQDSLAAGAKFLKSLNGEGVTKTACQSACCDYMGEDDEQSTCNLAVYKSKVLTYSTFFDFFSKIFIYFYFSRTFTPLDYCKMYNC